MKLISYFSTLPDKLPRWVYLVLLWVIASSIGIYFRLYPLRANLSHDAKEKATMVVINNLRSSIKHSVDAQYPQLPDPQRRKLVKTQFDQTLRQEGDNVRKTIETLAHTIDTQNPSHPPYPYLLESDPYLYYSLTENILKTGKISDTVKGSKYLNKLMLNPLGHWEPFNLHPYVGVVIHRILTAFNPDTPLMYSVSFTPLLIMVLSVAAFIWVATALGCSLGAVSVGSIYFVLAPIFIKRSMFGWYDNDPYNLLFPLGIIGLILYSLPRLNSRSNALKLSVLSALSMAAYALFWHGWVFLVSVVTAAGVVIVIYHYSRRERKTSAVNTAIYFTAIPVSVLLWTTLFFGPGEFFVLFKEGWVALRNFIRPAVSLWPDMYISVGELRQASLATIIQLTGNYFFFITALLGLVMAFVKPFRQKQKLDPRATILLLVFFIATTVITLGAQRFALLCVVPLSLFFCLGVEALLYFFRKIIFKRFALSERRHLVLYLTFPLLIVLLNLIPLRQAQLETPFQLNQIYNDTWQSVLTQLNQKTPAQSVINTWWPPGHFIKAIARRRVTFDGATINQPQAYWMANVFLSADEKTALGLLRMINNSANGAAEFLTGQGLKLSRSVELLKTIAPLSSAAAGRELASRVSPAAADELLRLTHARPPPSYLLIYNEIMENNIEFSFVGNWNFAKMEELAANPGLRAHLPPTHSPGYIKFLWESAGGPQRYSGVIGPVAQNGSTVLFDHNITIDVAQKICRIDSPKFGKGTPRVLFYLEDGELVEKKFPRSSLTYAVLLLKDERGYSCVLLDEKLARSMLVRLFFFNGAGLKYIRPFIQERDLSGRTDIKVFEVDWEALEKNL